MTQATEATSVKFKKFPLTPEQGGGDIIALFPEEPTGNENFIGSYMHVGQHGDASPELLTDTDIVDATPEEYAALRDELVSIGYTLNIL